MNVNGVWADMLRNLVYLGEVHAPRGQLTRELLGYQTTIGMSAPVLTVRERRLGYKFMPAEAAWILSGDNTVAAIAPFSKEIARFSDDGYSFFGAYGPRFIDQAGYVVEVFRNDLDTRQAVVTLWREQPRRTKDVPCTVALQWLIRNGLLHCAATMRSSDAWLGWPYDVFNFSMMSAFIALRLRVAGVTAVSLGRLTLTAGSQHLYERDVLAAKEIIERYEEFRVNPLNLDEFLTPQSLVEHLWLVADRVAPADGRHWLAELYHV